MNNFFKFIISITLPLLVGYSSSFFVGEIDTWYDSLDKPPFNPPNWIFSPVWTILYIMIGLSFYNIWKDRSIFEMKNVVFIYFLQLGLNFLWSLLFFGLKNPDVAFIEIFFLLITIFSLILEFLKLNRKSAYLLIPYLLWVSFAAVLNFSISILN